MANTVLVIDMLKGFLEEKYPLYCGIQARKIIPNIQNLLDREIIKGSKIIFICDSHNPKDLEFKIFPPHCIKGTPEAQIIPEFESYPSVIITKKRYSAFYGTNLTEVLSELKPEKLIICGVCTDICVLHTIAEARNREYEGEVPVNCVASFNTEAHNQALIHIEKILGAKLT
ncbi:MAG: cysteine hydrolase [Gammaproteobacteria bacterium]|nr:cysteine hydrolase [Gammaproteobacteria bacterium]